MRPVLIFFTLRRQLTWRPSHSRFGPEYAGILVPPVFAAYEQRVNQVSIQDIAEALIKWRLRSQTKSKRL